MTHHIPLMNIKPTLPTDLAMPVAVLASDKGEYRAVMPGHDEPDLEYSDFGELATAHGLDFGAHWDALGLPDGADFDH